MTELVECVPNFSEGRDRPAIQRIVEAIAEVEGVTVLDVDIGQSANRTVVTFVGTAESALEGAFRGIRVACQVIDMRQQQGTHWRVGAADVCPFVPLQEATMKQCTALAQLLGQRVADELGVPVCLYGEAAMQEQNRELATIRRGGYERLEARLLSGDVRPDFGTAAFNPQSGLTTIGARNLLIAYNVNLTGRNVSLARAIARKVRSGAPRTNGLTGSTQSTQNPQGLACCRANGWLANEYNCAQVTTNLTDYRVTGLHDLFERVKELAHASGEAVHGSEIVGLVPHTALLITGRYYAAQTGAEYVSDADLMHLAIQHLGLNSVREFRTRYKVLEQRLHDEGIV